MNPRRENLKKLETRMDDLAKAYARAFYHILNDVLANGSAQDATFVKWFWGVSRAGNATYATIRYLLSDGTVVNVASGSAVRSANDQANNLIGRLVAKGRAVENARKFINSETEDNRDGVTYTKNRFHRRVTPREIRKEVDRYTDLLRKQKEKTDAQANGIGARIKAATLGVVDEILEALKK